MELNIVNLSFRPLFVCLIFLVTLLVWLKLAKRRKLNLPPSPPKLPIIGNIHQLGKLPHRSLRNLSNKYGSLLLLQLGHTQTLVVSSVDLAREMLKNHDIILSNRPKSTAANLLLYGCSDVGFAPFGEYWKQIKKITVLELLSQAKVDKFQFIRDEEIEDFINTIHQASLKGEVINLSEMLVAVSNNMLSRCVLGRKSEEGYGSNKRGRLARRVMDLVMSVCIGDMFPYLWWLDVLTGLIPTLKAVAREMDQLLDQTIEEHKALKNHGDIGNKKDLLSFLLQPQDDGMFEIDLTQENIKAILLDTFIGSDSTSTTMEWLMAELLKHPNVMKKVQNEVRNVVGNRGKVDVYDINKMEYLKCVVKETLRLQPSGPLIAPREARAPFKFKGYDIPSKTTVIFNVWANQRDPNLWENPEEFIPERFRNNPIDFKGQDFQFIPFGYGRRKCPGMSLGIATTEFVIANLLYWFDWKLPAGEIAEDLDMSEDFGLTVKKKVPLHVLPVSYLSI